MSKDNFSIVMDTLTKSPWQVFLLFVTAAVIFRLPSLFIPYMDIDEVLWGLMANSLVDGGTPYISVMGEKPPLMYLSYAAIFALFGKHNYFAIHVFGILWMALTSFVIYHFVKKSCETKTALVAGLSYIIFGSATGFRMLATTGELLMNLPLVLSCLLFFTAYEKNNYKYYFLSAALALTAALFRQQSAIHMGAYLGFFLLVTLKERPLKSQLKSILAIFFGSAFVLSALYFYLHHTNSFKDFWFWNFSHNASYIKSGFLNHAVLKNFSLRTGHVLITTLPLWILAAFRIKRLFTDRRPPRPLQGLAAKGRSRDDRNLQTKFEILVVFYLLVSLVATIPGGRFFPHYFLQAFPALCILASLEIFEQRIFLRRLTVIYVTLIFLKMPFVPAEMAFNDPGDYAHSNKIIGDYIRDKSKPEDKIFIWGWSQGIYYYAQRSPAARFISSDFLSGRSPSQNNELASNTTGNITPGSWDMLFFDFDQHMPLYILDTSIGNYHDYGIYPIWKFPKLDDYIQKNYLFEKSIDGVDLYRLKATEP